MLRLTGRAVLVCLSLVCGLNVSVSSKLESQAVRKTLSEKDAPFDRSKFPAPWVKPTEKQLERSTQKPRSAGVRDGISLTSQQEQEMASIREKYRKTIKPLLKQAESAEKDAPIRKQIADLIEEQKKAVLSVLTSEQRQRYEINKRRLSALNSFSNEVLASAEVPPLWSSDFSFTKSSGPNADGYSLPLWEIPHTSLLTSYACYNGIIEITPCMVSDSSVFTQGNVINIAVKNKGYSDQYVFFDLELLTSGTDFLDSYDINRPYSYPFYHVIHSLSSKDANITYEVRLPYYSSVTTAEFKLRVVDYIFTEDRVTSSIFISGYRFKASLVEPVQGSTPMFCGMHCGINFYTQSTVAYRSLDIDRNVTLVYNSASVDPKPTIVADLHFNDIFSPSLTYSTRLLVEDVATPFSNGDSIQHFATILSDSAVRIAVQFDASSYTTGSYDYSLTISDDGSYAPYGNDATLNGKVYVVNGLNNPVAKGWDISGLQRWTRQMVLESDGSYTLFYASHIPNIYVPVNGNDFTIIECVSLNCYRRYQDNSYITFDVSGYMTAYTDPVGLTTVYEYETWGGGKRLKRILDPYRMVSGLPAATVLNYGPYGLSSIVEPGSAGRTTNFTVNSSRELTHWTDPDGRPTEFIYDNRHRLIQTKNRTGAIQNFAYDTIANKLVKVAGPSMSVDQGDGTTVVEIPETTFETWLLKLIPRVSSLAVAGIPSSTFVTKVITPSGDTAIITDNKYGYPVSIRNPAGELTQYSYAKRPINYWYPADSIPTPLVSRKINPDGSEDNFLFSFDEPMVRLLAEHKAGSSPVYYSYKDTVPLMVDSVWGAYTPTTRFFYDSNSFGQPSRVVERREYWHSPDLPPSFTEFETIYRYDSIHGRPTLSLENGDSPVPLIVTLYSYDTIFGNLSGGILNGIRKPRKTFDRYGRDSIIQSAGFAPIRTLYDDMNRETERRVLTGSTIVTAMLYDSLGLKSVTDGKGQVYRIERDVTGRPIREYAANSTTSYRSYRYDITGNLSSITNRRGQRIQMTYDKAGRMLSKSGSGIVDSFSYSSGLYNDNFSWNMVSEDSIRTLKENYSAQVRVWSSTAFTSSPTEKTRLFQVLRPERDGHDSLVVSLPFDNFASLRYDRDYYDPDQRVIRRGASTIWQQSIDVRQLPLREHFGGDYLSTNYLDYKSHTLYGSSIYLQSSISEIGKTAYGYDSLGRFTATQHERNDLQRQYKYDSLGRLNSVEYRTQSCQTWPGSIDLLFGYTYTCVPIPDSILTFTYDAVGNRTDKTHSYGDGNRMLTFGNLTFTYDADGNVTQKINSGTGVTWRYYWDILNRLSAAVRAGGDSITYEYNAMGKLVRRKTNGVIDRHWVYIGDHILAELDGSQRVRNRYMYKLGVDRPLASQPGIGDGGDTYFMSPDAIGNIAYQTVNGPGLKQEVIYDPWGKPTFVRDSTGNRLLWKGLLYQEEPGLYYVRNRWYDPEVGRFMSEDPIGLEGGINLYQFAAGDPVNLSDPSGLAAYLGCRPLRNLDSYGHCALRISNEDVNIIIELLPDGLSRSSRSWFGNKSVPWWSSEAHYNEQMSNYDMWYELLIPSGMTERDYDVSLINSAAFFTQQESGQRYSPMGGSNSNRFIYNIVSRAGGRLPVAATLQFLFRTPGLCGGMFVFTGFDCQW